MTGFLRSDRVLVLALSISVCFRVEVGGQPAVVCTGHVHNFNCTGGKVLSEKQIQLEAFSYDGKASMAHFVVGSGDEYLTQKDGKFEKATFIPNPTFEALAKGECGNAPEFDGSKPVTFTLPDDLMVSNITYLVLNCFKASRVFGYVELKGLTGLEPPSPEVVALVGKACERVSPPDGTTESPDGKRESSVPANLAAFWLIVILPAILLTKNSMNCFREIHSIPFPMGF